MMDKRENERKEKKVRPNYFFFFFPSDLLFPTGVSPMSDISKKVFSFFSTTDLFSLTEIIFACVWLFILDEG